MHFSDEDIDDLSEHNLNGRQVRFENNCYQYYARMLTISQIKNTMSIAQAIAIDGGKPLSVDQVKLVIKHFQSYSID